MELLARLQVNTEQLGDIQEIISYLHTFEQAYNHLYAFDFIFNDAKRRYQELNELSNSRSHCSKTLKTIIRIRKPEEIIIPGDRIKIQRIEIKSPGFWEFLGKLNPLEVLREYLNDRHERKKDFNFRNHQAEEQGDLQNAERRTKLIGDQAKLLREFGVPEEKIRSALFEHVNEPLGRIDAIQDKGLIVDAKIISENNKDNL